MVHQQQLQGLDMRSGKIVDVDVIADGGTIWRVIVVAENGKVINMPPAAPSRRAE
jgi:hypothetical protein